MLCPIPDDGQGAGAGFKARVLNLTAREMKKISNGFLTPTSCPESADLNALLIGRRGSHCLLPFSGFPSRAYNFGRPNSMGFQDKPLFLTYAVAHEIHGSGVHAKGTWSSYAERGVRTLPQAGVNTFVG